MILAMPSMVIILRKCNRRLSGDTHTPANVHKELIVTKTPTENETIIVYFITLYNLKTEVLVYFTDKIMSV